MPVVTITRQYLLPVYQHLVVDALTVKAACERAVDRFKWAADGHDNDDARATTIESIAKAERSYPREAPSEKQVPVPDRFSLEQQNANRAI